MNKTLGIFVVVVVIILGGFLLFRSGQDISPVDGGNAEVTGETNGSAIDTPTPAADKVTHVLDQKQSSLTWYAERIVGASHTGTVHIKSGNLTSNASGFTGGAFVIDMTTITESNSTQLFLTHEKSNDFFGVEQFPESTFVITSIESKGSGTYQVTGNLTIRDITNKISFPATATGDGDVVSVSADFTIDRTEWDIIFDSGSIFKTLGDKAIKDDVEFSLELVFTVAA
ncbi:YceI family protein [Candidatus Uhrbacteria bacterium]|nr:YceI family protein [Candidatus Uhrbacteria bacterium]